MDFTEILDRIELLIINEDDISLNEYFEKLFPLINKGEFKNKLSISRLETLVLNHPNCCIYTIQIFISYLKFYNSDNNSEILKYELEKCFNFPIVISKNSKVDLYNSLIHACVNLSNYDLAYNYWEVLHKEIDFLNDKSIKEINLLKTHTASLLLFIPLKLYDKAYEYYIIHDKNLEINFNNTNYSDYIFQILVLMKVMNKSLEAENIFKLALPKIKNKEIKFRINNLYVSHLIHYGKWNQAKNQISISDSIEQNPKTNIRQSSIFMYLSIKARIFIYLNKYEECHLFLKSYINEIKDTKHVAGISLSKLLIISKVKSNFNDELINQYLDLFEQKIEDYVLEKSKKNVIDINIKYKTIEKEKEIAYLTQKSETKDQLLSQLSHEIRTPLSIILGNTKQLISEIENNASIAKVKSIHRNSLNLMNQIDSVLEYNKLESGLASKKLEDCEIISFVKNIIQDFSILTQSKSIEVSLKANIQEASIKIDREKLHKILNNLLSNAIKYNVEGGQIEINLKLSKSSLSIEIKDTGIGIDTESIPHLFDKYYQVQQEKFVEGFGIGLNVVQSLVKSLEGTIEVESKVNQGSSFKISIPVSEATNVQKGNLVISYSHFSKLSENSAIELEIDATKPTIVLIDDNRELRQFIHQALAPHYNCIEASDGMEGYRLILDHQPDIILSDYMMPRMDGIQLLEKIRENPETNHLSFVMLTADNLEKTKLNIIKKGADTFITKPFNEDELRNTLHNIIAKQEALRQRFKQSVVINNKPLKSLSKNEQFIAELSSILEKNYSNEGFKVENICHAMNLTSMTLFRKTKALIKDNPTNILSNFRLEKAKYLLETQSANINEIAYQCGFNTPQYFSTIFKKKYGMSPSSIITR